MFTNYKFNILLEFFGYQNSPNFEFRLENDKLWLMEQNHTISMSELNCSIVLWSFFRVISSRGDSTEHFKAI